MSRRTTLTVAATGLGLATATAVAVPALAAGSPGAATTTATASASPTSGGSAGSAAEDDAQRPGGSRLLGAPASEVAKAAGASEEQLRQGLREGRSLTQVAAAHGVSKATLVQRLGALADTSAGAIVDRRRGAGPAGGGAAPGGGKDTAHPLKQALDGLVKKGTITQAQADAIQQAVRSQRQDSGPRPGPAGARPGHGGPLRGGPWRGDLAALASTVKLSSAELGKQLRSGKSLADVAKAQGVSRDTVVAKVASLIKADLPTTVDRVRSAHPDGARGGEGRRTPGSDGQDAPGSGSGPSGPSGSSAQGSGFGELPGADGGAVV